MSNFRPAPSPVIPRLTAEDCAFSGGARPGNKIKNSLPGSPLVSILTIVLNGEKSVEKAIGSVLGQSYENVEYIIVDGGSSDSTLDVVRRYEDKIDYWCSSKDSGISGAFNRGVSLCTGEIVGILNADDWYEKNTVAAAAGIFRQNPGAGVVHGDLRYYKGGKYVFSMSPARVADKIRREMIYNHPACFVKREVYLKYGGFCEELKVAMDYEFMLRIHAAGVRFAYSPVIVSNMQLGGRSDFRDIAGLREAYEISTAFGYPRALACMVFTVKAAKCLARNFFGRDSFIMRVCRALSPRKSV